MLQAWTPNRLPVPSAVLGLKGEAPSQQAPMQQEQAELKAHVRASIQPLPPMVEVDDNFPKGRIARFFPHQRYGFITDRNGRDVYFNLNEIDFVGEKGKEAIAVGLPIGYDVSHTSHGLHVKKMKIY